MNYSPEKIIIKNDFDDLAPPFCYRYQIVLSINEKIHAELDIEYYDREGLDKEEIYAEGFSDDDDFHWKGELAHIWMEELLNQINKAKQGKVKGSFELSIIEGEQKKNLTPKNLSQFEYLVQELIQGIYEITGKQNKLEIELLSGKPGQKLGYSLTVSFSERKAYLKTKDNAKAVNWDNCHQMLKQLYNFPMDSFNTYDKKPTKKGVFINLGDGYWYEAGVSILPGKDRTKSEDKLISLFQKLS